MAGGAVGAIGAIGAVAAAIALPAVPPVSAAPVESAPRRRSGGASLGAGAADAGFFL